MGCGASKDADGGGGSGGGPKPKQQGSVINAANKGPDYVASLLGRDYAGTTELLIPNNDLMLLPEAICDIFVSLLKLDISSNKLGDIPASIGRLVSLTHLDCNDNELKVLPPEIGKCVKLEVLLCYRNQLKALPKELGNLEHLNELNVFNNKILAIPEQIGALAKAEQLNFAANKMFKLEPAATAGWSSVEVLNVYDCRLLRLCPLGHLQTLKELRLFGNNLQTMPDLTAGLPNLTILELHRNDIAEVPDRFFDGLPSLKKLTLSRNKLTSLPASIAESNLETILLDDNAIEELPSEIASMITMQVLLLNGNKISNLPAGYLDNKVVTRVNLSGNPIDQCPQVLAHLKQTCEANGGMYWPPQ